MAAPVPAMSTSLATPAGLVNTGLATVVQVPRLATTAGLLNSPPVVATSTSAGLSGSIAILTQPSPARLVASSPHNPDPPEVETRIPIPNHPLNPPRCSPVPTNTSSWSRSAPKRTASAPTASEFATRLGTGAPGVVRKMKSSSTSQVAPPSGENHTPPSAAPTYTRLPPGPAAIASTRPDTTGWPDACPPVTANGPSGIQLTEPGPPWGASSRSTWSARRSVAARRYASPGSPRRPPRGRWNQAARPP